MNLRISLCTLAMTFAMLMVSGAALACTCGDGTWDPDNPNCDPVEQCDDGNLIDGDGCSSTCQIESFCGDGILDPGEACDDGNNTDGDGCSATCEVEPFCGDGNLDAGEACDDGNNDDGDGCSATCEVEPFCGDGNLDAGEECDDGNNDSGDGCSSACTLERVRLGDRVWEDLNLSLIHI